MNNQEIFNTVVTHLFAQGRPAQNSNGECQYRSLTGQKCAAGCLIPDEIYDPKMENLKITAVYASFPAIQDVIDIESLPLVGALQRCHDAWGKSKFDDDFVYQLIRIADHFKLDSGIVQTTPRSF